MGVCDGVCVSNDIYKSLMACMPFSIIDCFDSALDQSVSTTDLFYPPIQ